MHCNKLLISFVLCNLLQKGLTAHDSDGHQHKYFLPNTKFDNPLNWDTKRTPCAKDRAIISHDSKVSVYVATDLRIRQLVLATDGEVILAANASLLVTDVSSDKCSGKDVYFEVNSVKSWHDPSNWRFTEEDAEPIIPVPDVERTPCQDDHIVFLVNSSFQVAVDGQDALLQILTVNGLTMAAVDFQGYTDTKSGRMRFKLNKGITFSSNECNEPSGCICKNTNIPERKEYICGFLKGKCPQLRCDDPISPTGSCCPTCASMYLATIDNAFIMSNFRDYVINRLELKGIAETCQIFISRVSANSVQLVARDMIKHSDQEFITHLENNFNKGRGFAGIVGVKVQVSQNWLPSGDFYTGNKGFTAGPVAALILGFLTAIIIAALLFVHYRKQWPKVWRRVLRSIVNPFSTSRGSHAFTFARFVDTDEEGKEAACVEFAVEMANPFDTGDIFHGDSRGFGNPMYTVLPHSGASIFDDTTTTRESGMTHENPTFLVYDRIDDIPEVAEEEEEVPVEKGDAK